MFIPAFISVTMNRYKILHNDTIELSFVFQLHTFNLLFASLAFLQLNLAKRKVDKTEVLPVNVKTKSLNYIATNLLKYISNH